MSQKLYTVRMENGDVYGVPASVIAHNYADEYASRGEDYTENYDAMMNWFDTKEFEFADWAKNNMNWYDVEDRAVLLRSDHKSPDFQEGWVNGEYGYEVIETDCADKTPMDTVQDIEPIE